MKDQHSHVITFTVPSDLKEILEGMASTGYYDSLSEFLRDAIRSTLKTNKGLAAIIAFRLYKAKKISIGKAAAMLNTSLEETKEMLKALE
mgnify:CR=1 FL=1